MPTFIDITSFLGGQYFGKTWVPDVDLSSKVMVVTGGNTGLGLDCAMHLVRKKVSKVILTCRSVTKGQAARDRIIRETRCSEDIVEVWEVDLDHFDSVLAFTERIRSRLDRLDGFVANAGIELDKFEMSEGCERTLTVNVISTFLMVLGILPKLTLTASRNRFPSTLCLVGSMVHVFGPDAQLQSNSHVKGYRPGSDTFDALSDPKTADMKARYPLSKLAEHLCSLELVARFKSQQDRGSVTINIVNPGWCKTELNRNKGSPLVERIMAPIFQRTSEEGSRTLVHGVTAGSDTHGKYLSECQIKDMSAFVRSDKGKDTQRRLYEELEVRLERISPGITRVVSE